MVRPRTSSSTRRYFHPCVQMLESRHLLATFTVTDTLDGGGGSLRQAITDANANSGTDTIAFDIPGAGPHTLSPLTMLPKITDPLTIDGFSQPGASSGNLKIELRGTPGAPRGLVIDAGSSLVRGMVVNRFPEHAIRLETKGGNRIEGNYLGTDVSGTSPLGNKWGVLADTGSSGNIIGGTTIAARNVISGNTEAGIAFDITSDNIVEGNYIGTDATGLQGISGLQKGISIYSNSSDNRIGGTDPGAGNIISGNGQYGVFLGPSTGTIVQGNWIGLAVDGGPLGNGQDGIYIISSSHVIGGVAADAANVIAFNMSYGVRVETGTSVAIRHNSIFSNGAVGIELANGANVNQSAPFVQMAHAGGGSTVVQVRLFSDPLSRFNVDLFSSAVCDPSNFGEGETFLGSVTLTTGPTGRGRRQAVLAFEVPIGHVITATATNTINNSSEFSKCQAVSGNPAPGSGEGRDTRTAALRRGQGSPSFDAQAVLHVDRARPYSPLVNVELSFVKIDSLTPNSSPGEERRYYRAKRHLATADNVPLEPGLASFVADVQ